MSQVLSTTRQVWLQIISKNDIKESGLKLAGQCLKTITKTTTVSPELFTENLRNILYY